ncbi:MAG TPA: FAD-binding oxidoreductase [Vicinamibacterales bacterium]|nr:FAD-binding oxidoreductase [Vicinamibacterales bacterium]
MYLADAAHFPGGHAAGVVLPRSLDEVVEAVLAADTVLPIGAQSSLTGGATPMGEVVLSTSNMTSVVGETPISMTVQAGVTVDTMQERLARRGAWFPPAPTFTGACAGGIVATNAAGAATFKYGSTRDWVEALTVVLADGTVLRLRRGERHAHGGWLELEGRRVPVPRYRMPAVAKVSAGYFAAPDLDAVDLFVGSEGTLGVIAEVTFRILSPAPPTALALIACRSEAQAISLAGTLRSASIETRRTRDIHGVDAAAIENMDRRCIEILLEDGAAARHHVALPDETQAALLVQLELPGALTAERAYAEIAAALTAGAPDTPIVRFCRLLDEAGALAATELVMPEDRRRMQQLTAVREAVPAGVNQRVGAAKRTVDDRIAKTAADMVVPFERFAEMQAIYRRGFDSRGLDYAIWGHISDGNVHPNVIPKSFEDVEKGRQAILGFGLEAARLGGCPLAEHGVGRSPIKQALLRQLYGAEGIDQMRAVKRALDPDCRLAPGVIF